MLFKIRATINIHKENGRSLPIVSGYRPGFSFIGRSLTDGSIRLLDRDRLSPDDTAIVEIVFISDELLGDIKHGTSFKFYEGPVEIGKGEVIEVIGWGESN